jgi:hypothetical protein
MMVPGKSGGLCIWAVTKSNGDDKNSRAKPKFDKASMPKTIAWDIIQQQLSMII